jgi:ubiquitin carboxyl-terminal hydrolase CYLD
MFDSNPHNLNTISIAEIFRNSLAEIPAKLATIPPILILMAPRHTRSKRSYRYIVPDRQITLDNNSLQLFCFQCQKTNRQSTAPCEFFSCDQCYPMATSTPGCDAYIHCICGNCLKSSHHRLEQRDLAKHNVKEIELSKFKLNLFAVLCIETSHYVAFVKSQGRSGIDEWLLFDSMSDRIHNEINIPCVSQVPDFDRWLNAAATDSSFFDNLDDTRREPNTKLLKLQENSFQRLRLFRDGAFFFYKNPAVNYQ